MGGRRDAEVARYVDAALRRRRWSRRGVRFGLPLLAAGMALTPVVGSEWACSYSVAREGRSVPDLVGLDVDAAEEELAGGCLRLDVRRRSVPDAATGTVVAQHPAAPSSTVSRDLVVVVAGTAADPPWNPNVVVGSLEPVPGGAGDVGGGPEVLVGELGTVHSSDDDHPGRARDLP